MVKDLQIYTEYVTVNTTKRYGILDITDKVETVR